MDGGVGMPAADWQTYHSERLVVVPGTTAVVCGVEFCRGLVAPLATLILPALEVFDSSPSLS